MTEKNHCRSISTQMERICLDSKGLMLLMRKTLALFGLGDGRDEFSPATRIYDFLCGLPCFVQLPMLTGVVIGRVEDGFFEKEVAHS